MIEEGIHVGEPVEATDGPVYHEARLGKAASLADLVQEYAFFNHGALFCFTNIDVDPVHDYCSRIDTKCLPLYLTFPEPVFDGLVCQGDPSWNYRLIAIPRARWHGLDRFLCAMSAIDRFRKRFYRMVSQEIPIADALALSKLTVIPIPTPMVTINTYTPTSNKRLVAFAPADNPPVDRPRIVFHPPEPGVVLLAKAHFDESDTPMSVIENRQGG